MNLSNIRENIRFRVEETSKEFDTPAYFVWIIWSLPFVVITLQLLLSFEFLEPYRRYFWGENHFIELAQFGSMFLGGMVALNLAWHMYKQYEVPLMWIFFGLFALGLIFTAMEEIAWGQQFLGFRTPDFIKEQNVQHELTFHNLKGFQENSLILNLFFSLGGFIGIFVYLVPGLKKLSVPKVLTIWFVLMIPLSLVSLFMDQFNNQQVAFIVDQQSGTVELLIGISGLLYVWLKSRKLIYSRIRPIAFSNLQISPKYLKIRFLDDREVGIPRHSFPWMGDQSLEDLSDYRFLPRMEGIHWPQIGKTIPTSELLGSNSTRGYPGVKLKSFSPYLIVLILAGLISVLWLFFLPSDPKNVWLLGLSRTRLAMIVASLGMCLGLWRVVLFVRRKKIQNQQEYLLREFSRIHFILIFWGAVIFFFFSTILFVMVFSVADPFLKGILSRLGPWIFWMVVIWGCIIIRTNQELLRKGRWEMAEISGLDVLENEILIQLTDQRKIWVPFPWLQSIKPSKLDSFQFTHSGRRLIWSGSNSDLCVAQLWGGFPPE